MLLNLAYLPCVEGAENSSFKAGSFYFRKDVMTLNIYSSYRCRTCGKEFVLLVEDAERQERQGRYLACPFCCSKRVNKEKITDSLRECMQERAYKRVNGALRQK